MPIYSKKKPLKIFFPGTSGTISTKLGMYHQGIRPIIICLNYYPDLDLFFGKVKFGILGFYMENVTVIYSLEIIAAFDLEIG